MCTHIVSLILNFKEIENPERSYQLFKQLSDIEIKIAQKTLTNYYFLSGFDPNIDTYIKKIINEHNQPLKDFANNYNHFVKFSKIISKLLNKDFILEKSTIKTLLITIDESGLNETLILSLFLSKFLFESLLPTLNNNIYEIDEDNEVLNPLYSVIQNSFEKTTQFFHHINHSFIPYKIELEEKKIKHMFLKTTMKLIHRKILKEKLIYTNKKSIRFIHLPLSTNNITKTEVLLFPSILCTLFNEPYTANIFYWNFKKLQQKNLFSTKTMEFNHSTYPFVNNVLNTKLHIDFNILTTFFNEIRHIYKNKGLTLDQTKNYKFLIDNLKYWCNYPNTSSKLPTSTTFNIKKNLEPKPDKLKKKKEIQTEINKYIEYSQISNIISNKDLYKSGFYLSFFMDFRGRIYYTGNINPTNNKIFRSCLNYGKYTEKELNWIEKNITKTKCWTIIEKHLATTCALLNIDKSNYKSYELSGLFWSLIELSKINKSKLIDTDHINILKFLEEGTKILRNNKPLSPLDSETYITILKVKNTINNILTHNHTDKTIYFKDSTASVLQHLLKLLGPKDTDSLKYCNFTDNENWWDPYSFIINSFTNNITNNDIKILFNRKTLKKMIMTFNYNATIWTNINDTMEEVRKTENYNNILKNDPNIDKKIITEVIKFHNHLKTKYELEFFFKNKSDHLYNEWKLSKDQEITTADNSKFNVLYNTLLNERMYVTTDNIRSSLLSKKISNKIDPKTTKRAFKANLIHISDSQYLRLLLTEFKTIAIHDSFGIDIFNIPWFIDKANIIINKKLILNDFNIDLTSLSNSYSIFLLL